MKRSVSTLSCLVWVLALIIFFSSAQPSSSEAAELGDTREGLEYTKLVCAPCHAIEAGGKRSPVKAATPFQLFANAPGVNRAALLVFLQTSHATMPNLIVKGRNADNVIAYLLSLKNAD